MYVNINSQSKAQVIFLRGNKNDRFKFNGKGNQPDERA